MSQAPIEGRQVDPDSVVRLYPSLAAADGGLEDGEVAHVYDLSTTNTFLAQITAAGTSSWTAVTDIAPAGSLFYAMVPATVVVYQLSNLGTVIDTLTVGTAVKAIAHDGRYLYVAYTDGASDRVAAYDDGDLTTPVWTTEAAELDQAPVNALYADGQKVFVALGGTGSVGYLIARLDADDGAVDWIDDPTGGSPPAGGLKTVITDGYTVFVGGDEITGGTYVGDTLLELAYDDGANVLRSGSVLADGGAGSISDICFVDAPVVNVDPAVSDQRAYLCIVGEDSAAQTANCALLSLATGGDFNVLRTARVGTIGEALHSCAWDGKLVYLTGEVDGSGVALRPYDPATGNLLTGYVRARETFVVRHDGFALYAGGNKDASNDAAWRHYTNPAPSLVRKSAGTERYRWPTHYKMQRLDLVRMQPA